MANVNRINGLSLVTGRGAETDGRINMYLHDSGNGVAIYVGDLVKLAGSAGLSGGVVNGINTEGMATVVQSAAGDVHVGVCVGVLPKQTDLSIKHCELSTSRIILVADDPNSVFEVSEASSGGTALAAVDVGLHTNVVVGSGSATTGMSGTYLSNSAKATTAALDVDLLGLASRPDNAFGFSARWLVRISNHQYGGVSNLGIS